MRHSQYELAHPVTFSVAMQYHGSHGALGDRARKLHQGILIIRFEMPFNVWCQGCGHLIGKGVRFNAEKKQIGMYHTTKIWSFVMRAPCCQQRIEVHTDPRNAEYVVVSGARRKLEGSGDDDRVAVDPNAERRPMDAIGKLEAAEEDARRGTEERYRITGLREESNVRYKDDAANNRLLRRRMREARREEASRDTRRKELGLPEEVCLVAETETDRLRAAAVSFGSGLEHQKAWKRARKNIAAGSIFSQTAQAAARKSSKKLTNHVGPPLQQKSRRLDVNVKLRLSNPGT